MNHTYFYMGMAMLQVVYITYQYILLRRPEYIYYIFYTIIFSICIFYKAYPGLNPFQVFVVEGESFTACRGLLLIGLSMYLSFGRYFTETPKLYKRLNYQLLFVERTLIILGTLDVISQAIGMNFFVMETFSKIIYLLVMFFCVYVISFLITRKRVLTTILVLGSSCLLLFAMISLVDIVVSKNSTPGNYSLYLELGIVTELLFLNYGLIYKTRLLQKENIQLEVSKQIELYNQRVAISSDLHDEVGTTLSGIALYSHLAAKQTGSNDQDKLKKSLSIIQNTASEMVSKLNDIIWTVNPKHDSMVSMLQHLEEFIMKMATAKGMEVNIEISNEIGFIFLPMEHRKNIYLICKEIINNSVKYAECTKIIFKVIKEDNRIIFLISDNGLGFHIDNFKAGNGIDNMKQRAALMGANIKILTDTETGTEIILSCKIPQ